jgi:hypothetical protein
LKLRALLSPVLAAAGLIWCIVSGYRVWVTPIRYVGSFRAPGQSDIPLESYRSFSDVSDFGALPLIIPVVLAVLATWAAWTGRKAILALATALIIGYSFITGFSIGSAYHPAAGILVLATVTTFVVNSGHSG